MPVTVVVGGQYGSEGKGKVVALTARQFDSPVVVRCGGPNSGHSTIVRGKECVLRQLPAAAGQSDATLALAAGCVIDEEILIKEIQHCELDRDRLVVDPRAVLVTDADREAERELVTSFASTGSGNGSALAGRVLRSPITRLAGDAAQLAEYARVEPLAPTLHRMIDIGRHLIVEGTQGFGLSLLHGPSYPFVTSKDTTAAAFAMESGISPRDVDEIILVIRTFPIRVGGRSGALLNELSWEKIKEESGALTTEPEFTSVTKKLRRVARFDLEMVRSACRYNKPTCLAVMGLDRIDIRNRNASLPEQLTPEAMDFLSMLKSELHTPIGWVGTGFRTLDVVSFHEILVEVFDA
ncbi:Adenylosuccinate synthetase [Symmachiella dynata]|uniref:Adenylosuccinate synthetase n=1 Tax=Symmachiella dynata TaxID=2527995 RepID=A0A517ZK24_9PLAN|nr:adenylosuccinate synthetase [Symmachiella dynata]QDU42852.1 Adenylosuccinate synthetase [Symmachiella dynata]